MFSVCNATRVNIYQIIHKTNLDVYMVIYIYTTIYTYITTNHIANK